MLNGPRLRSSVPFLYGALVVLIWLTLVAGFAAGPLAIIPGAAVISAIGLLVTAYGHRSRTLPHPPPWDGLVPVLSPFCAFFIPASGYLEIVSSELATRSAWPPWLYVCLPASALGPTDPSFFVWLLLALLNVAVWMSVFPALSAIFRLLTAVVRRLRAA